MRQRRPMKRMSDKRRASQQYTKYDPVYARVDQRSAHRCEVTLDGHRCPKRLDDHHHTRKPRETWHAPEWVMAICRPHHDLEEAGRLETLPNGDETFTCRMLS